VVGRTPSETIGDSRTEFIEFYAVVKLKPQ